MSQQGIMAYLNLGGVTATSLVPIFQTIYQITQYERAKHYANTNKRRHRDEPAGAVAEVDPNIVLRHNTIVIT